MFADMMDTIGFVAQQDPEVGQAMVQELKRQRRNLELIASENIVSPAPATISLGLFSRASLRRFS